MKSKILIVASFLFLLGSFNSVLAQQNHKDKKPTKKNLTIKEWNTNKETKTKFLDHVTVYNETGQKLEEVEYANYGIKTKIVYSYDENKRCIQQTEYDGRNRIVEFKKFEYNPDGTKKKQITYSAKGKVTSEKEFEYIYK